MNSVFPFTKLALLGGAFVATSALAQDNIILKNGTEIQAKVLEVAPGQIRYRRQDNPDGPLYTTGTTDVLLIRYANGTKDILGQPTGNPVGSPAVGGTLTAPAPAVNAPTPATGRVALSRLTYHSGFLTRYFTDGTGSRLDRSMVRSLLVTQADAMQAFERGQSLRRWSGLTTGAAVVLVGTGAAMALTDGETGRNRRENASAGGNRNRRGDGTERVGLALAGGGLVLGAAAVYLGHRATVQFRRATNHYNRQLPATSLRFGPDSRSLGVGLIYAFQSKPTTTQ